MKKKIGIIIGSIIIVLILIVSGFILISKKTEEKNGCEEFPYMKFEQDNNAKTLTVTCLKSEGELRWSDFDIRDAYSSRYDSGETNLTILSTDEYVRVGDVISNCWGNVSIRFIPANILIGKWEFPKV